jgi:hypothetical protein
MEDNQNIYLDKVIEFLVRGTKVDYDIGEIYTPYEERHYYIGHLPYGPPINFEKHCKDVYGLTYEETDYVWEHYRRELKKITY